MRRKRRKRSRRKKVKTTKVTTTRHMHTKDLRHTGKSSFGDKSLSTKHTTQITYLPSAALCIRTRGRGGREPRASFPYLFCDICFFPEGFTLNVIAAT